nr:MAG TPA: hypothetical protein [Caudoviricetes sp.]
MILTERIITVNGNISTLDAPIYLYQGDKNVDIYFSIVNPKYKFSKKVVDNLLGETAAYFDLYIIKPDGSQVSFKNQAIEDKKAKWTIESELIDEEIEIGKYDFQIRLLDENKTSILTIPPLLGQLEILKPIYTDSDTPSNNLVNLAATNYALATSGNNDVVVFDEDGNYVATVWTDKMKITDTLLNKIETAIKQNTAQYKDIAKKTVIEDGKLYLVKPDGTKLDKGTILPTSENSSNFNIYKTEYIGELYSSISNYCAWCPCDLHFDKTLDKYVMLIYSADAHIHQNSSTYVTYIDKDTFVSTEPVKCKFVDSNGSTDITPTQAGSCSYIILKDGTYLMLHTVSDGSIRRLISEDNGKTWKSTNVLTNCFQHPWQMKELSNGRIICSDDERKVGFMYSDDKGLTWTKVVPTTCGGDYEAEAFIIELQPNKLMAIGRYSMSGIGYNEIGDSEPAIISYSNDNGTSWSAWQKSTSITNMNASSCTGIIHDGIVEIFATSRWYYVNDSKYNNDWKNTGKNGAMFHYVATIENALNDNFTNMGVVTYSNGSNAGDFHSPCIALDNDKNGLIVYFDKIPSATCGHNFIRCTNKTFTYIMEKDSDSPAKAYSAKYVNTLFTNMLGKINTLQYAISQIPGSGVDKPTGTLIWTKEYNADTATKPLSLNTYDGPFKEYITVSQYPTGASIQTLAEDSLKAPNNKTAQTYSMVINIPTTKPNFAGYIYGRTGRIDGNMGSASHVVKLSAVIDNVLYTLSLGGNTTDYTELYIEYNGGKKIFKQDNIVVTPTTTTLDSSHELYGTNRVLVGYGEFNNYVCYRQVKFGEWDS